MQGLKRMLMNERGAAAGVVIAIVLVGAGIFVGVQLIPIYWDHWNLEDIVEKELQFAFVNYKGGNEKVKAELEKVFIKFLSDNKAQYKPQDVKVRVETGKKIYVDISYSRPHKVPFLQNPKQFSIKKENTPI